MSNVTEALKTSSPTVFKHLIDSGFITVSDITDDMLVQVGSHLMDVLFDHIAMDRWVNIMERISNASRLQILKKSNFQFGDKYLKCLVYFIRNGFNNSFELALDRIGTLTHSDIEQIITTFAEYPDKDVKMVMEKHSAIQWTEELFAFLKKKLKEHGRSYDVSSIEHRLTVARPLQEAKDTIAERDAEIAALKKQLADTLRCDVKATPTQTHSATVPHLHQRLRTFDMADNDMRKYLVDIGFFARGEITYETIQSRVSLEMLKHLQHAISDDTWKELAIKGGRDRFLEIILDRNIPLEYPFQTLKAFNYGHCDSLTEFITRYPLDAAQTTDVLQACADGDWAQMFQLTLEHPNTQLQYDNKSAQFVRDIGDNKLIQLYEQRTGCKFEPVVDLQTVISERDKLAKELADLKIAIAKCV